MIYLDCETYSELDVSVVGPTKYAAHPTTEVMLLCWAVDDGAVQVWDRTVSPAAPASLVSALAGHKLCAHSVGFERAVLGAVIPELFGALPITRWVDSSVLARTCGLPASLAALSAVLGWGTAHKKRGDRLVQMFCGPTPGRTKLRRYTVDSHFDEWQEFIDYCMEDVRKCRRLWTELPHHVMETEARNWHIDTEINSRGLPIDLPFVRAALTLIERATAAANERMRELTGGGVPSVNAVTALASFLGINSVAADQLDNLLAGNQWAGAQREAALLRRAAGKSGVAKYARAAQAEHCGRIHDAFMFYGATRTGRASGQLIQPQNMARPLSKGEALRTARSAVYTGVAEELYDDPLTLAGGLVRTMIAAPPGRKLVACDYSNVEGRVLAWLAGEQWKLDAFVEFDQGRGPDLYRLAYARAFGKPVDTVSGDERQVGKVMELALGYQGGVGAFESMARGYGVRLPLATVTETVRRWRETHPMVRKLWREVESAAVAAVQDPRKQYTYRGLTFAMYRRGTSYSWLVVRLPSGRGLYYFQPSIERGEYGPKLTYSGQVVAGAWGRIDTFGGKLVENITQAVARDILMAGLEHATVASLEVILHAHDEILVECDEDDNHATRQLLADCMLLQRPWYDDLPLAVSAYEDYFYRKD